MKSSGRVRGSGYGRIASYSRDFADFFFSLELAATFPFAFACAFEFRYSVSWWYIVTRRDVCGRGAW